MPAGSRRALLDALLREEGLGGGVGAGIPRREGGTVLPLSFAQQRMWVLHELEPASAAFNIQRAIAVDAPLEVESLQHAVDALVRRHEILRTTFTARDGEPFQIVREDLGVAVDVVDVSELSEEEREDAVRERIDDDAARPFDFERGPLVRVSLVRRGPTQHMVCMTMHHIVSDGWSLGVLTRELNEQYTALVEDREPNLEPLPIQYADFAVWQRGDSGRYAADLEYWRQQLAAPLPRTELRPDYERPPVQSYRGARVTRALPGELRDAIADLAAREGATPFMALLAVLDALLARHTGVEDVVIGSPVAGRTRAELEPLVGFFVNTLVLRTDVSGDPSFVELLARVRRTALEAFAHQEVPFERLLEELDVPRDASRTPAFSVFLNMLAFGDPSKRGHELRQRVLLRDDPGARFDLTLYVQERADSMRLTAVYDADLFEPDRMGDLLAQFELLLRAAVERPSEPLSRVPLVTETVRDALPDPDAALDPGAREPLHALVGRAAALAPARTAIDGAGESTSYADLVERAARIGAALRRRGLTRGDTVAVLGARGAPLVTALLGVLHADAAFIVLDVESPPAHVSRGLQLAGASALLATSVGAEPALAIAEPVGLPLLLLDDLAAEAAPEPASGPSLESDLAYVALTSGSTGEPRAVLGEHGPVAAFVQWQAARFGLGCEDRFAMVSSLGHDPLLRDVFTPLALGATLYVPSASVMSAPPALRQWLRDMRITVLHATPSLARLLCSELDDGERLGDLRHVFFGGDLLRSQDVELMRRLAPEATYVNFYGTTETPQGVSFFVVPSSAAGDRRRSRVPLGADGPSAQLLVVAPHGGIAGVGELGEIHVRSPNLARGYTDERATRERFLPSPAPTERPERSYRTGDIGTYTAGGDVEFVGRADRQVKVRGFRVELEEVELALLAHPSVDAAAVVLDAHGDVPSSGESMAAYVETSSGDLTAHDLRLSLLERLPAPLVPSSISLLAELPRTATGKLDRRALATIAPLRMGESEHPRPGTETTVARIWSELLDVDGVGAQDRFFDLGGHSLLALRAIARIEAETGVRLTLRQLVYQTLRQVARECDRAADAAGPPAASRPGRFARLLGRT